MDPAPLLAIAKLARPRATLQASTLAKGKDGMQRLGGQRALEQLAADLELSAAHVGREADDDLMGRNGSVSPPLSVPDKIAGFSVANVALQLTATRKLLVPAETARAQHATNGMHGR